MYRILAAALLALALLASPAAAKEIEQVTACGPDGCRTVDSPGGNAHGLFPSENLPAETPEAGAFYRLRIGIGDGSGKVFDTFTVLWAPQAELLANDEPAPAWFAADSATAQMAREITEGVSAYPAADMPGARPPAPAPAGHDDQRRRRAAVVAAHRRGDRRPRGRAAGQTGTTPCRFHGRSTRFPAAISRARMIVGRVSRGSITSSIMSLRAAM